MYSHCLVWAVRGLLPAAVAWSGTLPELVAVTTAASVLGAATSVSLGSEIGSLPGPVRLRAFTASSVTLHAASMSSMLLLPAVLERAPRASIAAAGLLTAAAGLTAWMAARAFGRREPASKSADTSGAEPARG